MAEAGDSDLIVSKRKAINTLLPYAIHLEQSGRQGMIDAIFRAARASDSVASNTGKFMWRKVVLYISRLFEERSPTSLNRVIALISPYVPWDGALNNTVAVARWATAASEIPYTEEVGSSVVDALLQIASVDFLRPLIPVHIWRWLKRQPSLPPIYHGLLRGSYADTVAYVRRLGDIGILKSYFLLLWTDRYIPDSGDTHVMERSIREDFRGTAMKRHRQDLIERLDYVLWQLDQCLDHTVDDKETLFKHYTKLKDALLDVEDTLTCVSHRFIPFQPVC